MVLHGLKPRIFNRLNKFGERWVMELLKVLWSLRTIPSWATSYTPFFMVYGFEVILPTNLDYGAPRVREYDEQGAEASPRMPWTSYKKHTMLPSSARPSTS